MAFCGVDTGSMKPNDAAKVAARAGTNGLTPAATATGMMIGTTTAADAVLLVVSDTTIASSTPKMMPVPNSTMVPQSICAASFHLSVNSRLCQSVGSRNSSAAPNTATVP